MTDHIFVLAWSAFSLINFIVFIISAIRDGSFSVISFISLILLLFFGPFGTLLIIRELIIEHNIRKYYEF